MGNSDSKLVFKQGIFKLSEPEAISPDDTYWTGVKLSGRLTLCSMLFWKLPESTEDVFSLFSPVDVRRARDGSLKNVETLLNSLISRLTELRNSRAFPDSENAPEKEALNCIRVLTRLLPFLYEADHLETWEEKFFWERRKRKSKGSKGRKTEILFDESHPEDIENLEDEKEHFEDVKPLGEELIDTLIDLLFYTNFTLPRTEWSKTKVTYAIWQNGVGCNTPMSSSKELESNRTEVLRLNTGPSTEELFSTFPGSTTQVPRFSIHCGWHEKDFESAGKTPLDPVFLASINKFSKLQATSSYLPGSQKPVMWASEMIMLFWETLQCNKRFRSFILDSGRGNEFVILVLFYALEYKTDPAKQGVVRMCVFVLQTLSTEPEFGKHLNKPYTSQSSLPVHIRLLEFNGTYADYLIISIHRLITTSKGKLDAIYPALLATINNIAAYIQDLSPSASTKLLHLYASMSAPSFLLANETNHALLQSLLESLNAIIEHQYKSNRALARMILKSKRRFEALRTFTLESGQEETERLNQRRKDSGDGFDAATSPVQLTRTGSVDSARSPQSARTPSLSNVPEESGTFTIGEDEDFEEEENTVILPTPSQSSPSGQNTRTPSRSSSVDEPLPTQLRGMSEKARGKMPAGQPAFSRQNSSTSLSSHAAILMSPLGAFHPSARWIESWLPTLPLHTILNLLDYSNPSAGAVPKNLPPTIDPSPPRVHLFSWTPLSLGWYQSLLWGFIFASEMVVQKGTVGVWNATSIRLFKVEKEAAIGPSLTRPMGAVDAVGSNLVQRIGRMGVKAESETRRVVRDV
ncbi:MAG: hypothetical protein Q9167_002390 [Letrouitia subvulpina]